LDGNLWPECIGIDTYLNEVILRQRKSAKDGDARTMTRLERFSTSAINVTNGDALTMAMKPRRVQGVEKESSTVEDLTHSKALIREAQIKAMPRYKKEDIICLFLARCT
jgi:hypothetical protein